MIELLAALAAAKAAAPDFSWLAGSWVHCSGSTMVEERWIGPAHGVMVGANLARSDKKVTHEFFRIGPGLNGTWTFYAQPGGQPPVAFPAVDVSRFRVVFENRGHDFPQRVTYWRDGANLRARIEGTWNGQAQAEEWKFSNRSDPRQCESGAK